MNRTAATLFSLPGSRILALLGLALLGWVPNGRATPPVEFVFRPPPQAGNPFARELWAEVVTPSTRALRLPVFYLGDGRYAVRARAEESGTYRLGAVTENIAGTTATHPVSADPVVVQTAATLPQIQIAAGSPPRFVRPDGTTWQPLGSNLAWARGDAPVPYFTHALRQFHREGINWIRIWMAHWGRLNLDWMAGNPGHHPAPGTLDPGVADSWDRIIATAENEGVYVQLVLQHHGQYSSHVNPNWSENPWNAARPGGFLSSAGEFFTSPRARELTALKYRYIVARWGYSPAILAWELFNEVHWVDAYRLDHNEAAVAAWHTDMAARLRSYDRYGHLVTTSTENLRSPIYAGMDYFQPHLYPADLIAAVRQFDPVPAALGRPVFYGEMGDDHLAIPDRDKKSGAAIVPPVWASLMGRGSHPAQVWLGWDLLEQQRLGELGAVARFLSATRLGERPDLREFSAIVECATRVPLVIPAGQVWQRRAAPELELPLDGREIPEIADVPRNLAFKPASLAEGMPRRATYHLNFPRATTLRARVSAVGPPGGSLRLTVDGAVAAEQSWREGDRFPAEVEIPVTAGRHTLVVENASGPHWVQVDQIDLGLDTSVLAAIGRRNRDFIAVWVRHREGVLATAPPAAARGTVLLDDVPAGNWQATWWNTLAGTPGTAETLRHPGGTLRVSTPAIDRHAALVLEKLPDPAAPLTMPAPAASPLFAPENLLAWCIVPYDSRHRTPVERMAMLRHLGFTQYVWDWRAKHLAELPEEIRAAREAGVRMRGVWLWIDAQSDSVGALGASNRAVIAAINEARLPVEFWVGFHPNFFADIDEEARVARGAAMIAHLRDLARTSDSTVALYNHGDWFGEPASQLRLLAAVGDPTVGLVYNFHHGHDQLAAFADFLPRILPHLRAVNLNGMNPAGPKILPLGTGTHERAMIRLLESAGYRGPLGILGHVDDADVEEVLARNLAGLRDLTRTP